jgi:hypothetical protein
MELEGIQFVVNSHGEKTAVIIDLTEHSQAWEDFYDGLIADSRRGEPTISLENLRQELGHDKEVD